MSDLSDNTRANYRSVRNRVQRGIDTGFYTEAELPAARKKVEELNMKLGETSDTIRGPGRPRSAVRVPTGMTHQAPYVTIEAVSASEERLKKMVEESKQRHEQEMKEKEKKDDERRD